MPSVPFARSARKATFPRLLIDGPGPPKKKWKAPELVSAIVVPPADTFRGTYIKFTTGSSEERPCAGIATLGRMADGVCRELRLVVGAVSPKPVRPQNGESMARGERLTQDLIERIARDASRTVDPIDDLRGSAD